MLGLTGFAVGVLRGAMHLLDMYAVQILPIALECKRLP